MATDMNVFRKLLKTQISSLADDKYLRDLWLGNIPGYVGSPTESICQFFDTAIENLLERPDTGFNEEQRDSLRYLMNLMDNICKEENIGTLPPTFIDDSRWQKVIAAAKETKKLLDE